MPYNPDVHHRRSIRLKGYDYTSPGAYFVTLLVQGRECLFGSVFDDAVTLTPAGMIVSVCCQQLLVSTKTRLDAWVVMPNHFHAIVVIQPGKGEASAVSMLSAARVHSADVSPLHPIGTQPGSLGAIIQNFKSISTRRINRLRHTPGLPVWQRNYYEHIIRDDAELMRVRQYIQDNPRRWMDDEDYVV